MSGTPRLAIGIDLGGTKVAGGLVEPGTGRLLARRQEPTAAGGGAAVLAQVEAMAAELLAEAESPVLCIGLGMPELVDRDGRVFSGHRIDWRGLAPAERLGRLAPARIEADVRAAALAEARLGAGRRLHDFLYVSIGTGVSAVSVQDGRPYPGARGAALVLANGPSRQVCGRCGALTEFVLEDEVAGPGLVRGHRARGGAATDAAGVLALAAAGEAAAREVVDLAALRLGQALALLAGALDPEAVVLGGGLGSAPGAYFDALGREIAAGLWSDDARPLPFRRAALGPDAGLIGAALTAADRFTHQKPEHRPTIQPSTRESTT